MALAPIQGPKPLAPQANATLQAAQNRSGPFTQNGISVRRPKVTDKPARGTDGPMPITKRTVNLEAGVRRGVVGKSPKPLGRAGHGPGFVARELPWCGARVARMRGHPSMPRATGSRPVRSAGLVPSTACVLEHTARGVVQEVTVLAHKGTQRLRPSTARRALAPLGAGQLVKPGARGGAPTRRQAALTAPTHSLDRDAHNREITTGRVIDRSPQCGSRVARLADPHPTHRSAATLEPTVLRAAVATAKAGGAALAAAHAASPFPRGRLSPQLPSDNLRLEVVVRARARLRSPRARARLRPPPARGHFARAVPRAPLAHGPTSSRRSLPHSRLSPQRPSDNLRLEVVLRARARLRSPRARARLRPPPARGHFARAVPRVGSASPQTRPGGVHARVAAAAATVG